MKNILLIGGSYGIGLAIAQELQADCNIYIASRTNQNISYLNVTHIPFDVLSDTLDIDILPTVIDGFVYCPGSINLKPFRALKSDAFQNDMEINFFAMIRILQTILPNMQASENASVVLFSSVAAQTGMPFHTSISAAKGAIEGFSKSFAAEFAPKIRINVIAPSLTDTPLADKFLNSEDKREKSAFRNPMKRFGTPQDIAQMTCFLISEKSSWITGQVFHVDGGMSTLSVS